MKRVTSILIGLVASRCMRRSGERSDEDDDIAHVADSDVYAANQPINCIKVPGPGVLKLICVSPFNPNLSVPVSDIFWECILYLDDSARRDMRT